MALRLVADDDDEVDTDLVLDLVALLLVEVRLFLVDARSSRAASRLPLPAAVFLTVVSAPPVVPAVPPRAAADAALRKVDWRKVQRQVLAFALTRTSSKADAQDLTQEAIRRAFDPEQTAWNFETSPDIAYFLMSLVRQRAFNQRRGERTHPEINPRNARHEIRTTRAAAQVAAPAPDPEQATANHELCARRLAALRARAAADPLVLQLVDLMAQDIETPAEQVEALGVPLEDIRRARRRLFDHADVVARELPSGGNVATDDDGAEVDS